MLEFFHAKECLPLLELALGMLPVLVAYVLLTQKFAVYHDELWNYPQAISLLNRVVWRAQYSLRFLGSDFPLVSGPYQGDLKTYLLVPWLSFFGTSPWSMRGFHVLLTLGFLLATFWAVQPVLGTARARLVLWLPWVSPALVAFAPLDQGPILLTLTLTSLIIGSLLRYVCQSRAAALSKAVFSSALLLWDKLTNIPIAAVGLLTSAYYVWRQRKTKDFSLAKIVLLCILPLLPWFYYFATNGFSEFRANISVPDPGWASRVYRHIPWLGHAFSAQGVLAGLADAPPPATITWLPAAAWAVAVLGLITRLPLFRKLNDREVSDQPAISTLPAFLLVFTTAVFTAVPGLFRPWHFWTLLPLLLFSGISGFQTHKQGLLRFLPLRLLLTAGILVVIVHDATAVQLTLWQLRRSHGRNLAGIGLYALAHELEREKIQHLVCLNYSLCNPIYVLLQGKIRITDATWWSPEAESWRRMIASLQMPSTALVWRTPPPESRDATSEWLRKRVAWLEEMEGKYGPMLNRKAAVDPSGTAYVLAQYP